MDIVYTLKHDPENNSEELRYSLRSLQNVPHDKVVIVGESPDWVRNVLFIPVPQNGTKNENVRTNLVTAAKDERISDDFVLMNDDFFIMKPLSAIPNLNFGSMAEVLEAYDKRYPQETNYIQNMRNLYNLLCSGGFNNPISYELHMPMIINRGKAQRLFNDLQGERMYQFRTYYGNHCHSGGQAAADTKVFLEPEHNDPAFNQNPLRYMEAQMFLSATGSAFKKGPIGEFIRGRFPNKSPYER